MWKSRPYRNCILALSCCTQLRTAFLRCRCKRHQKAKHCLSEPWQRYMFQRLTHEIRPSDPKCGSHRTHKDTRFVLLPAAGASISKTLATDKELVLLSEWLSSKICPFRQSENCTYSASSSFFRLSLRLSCRFPGACIVDSSSEKLLRPLKLNTTELWTLVVLRTRVPFRVLLMRVPYYFGGPTKGS